MQTALLQEPFRFEVVEADRPKVGPSDVLVQVAACGVCGTDVEAFVGHQPRGWTITYPFRMGHELAGTVVEVGAEVPNIRPGDRVVPDGRIPCGYCYYCRRGWFSACPNQRYFSGGLSQFSAYSFRNVVRVPESISFEEAAFAEPLACVVNGQSKLEVPLGGVAVVIGDGPIGLLHMQVLKHRGAFTVMAGLLDHRLQVAKQLGADVVVNVGKEDLGQVVRGVSDGRGADVVVSAVGKAEVLKSAIEVAGRRGQVLFFAATMQPKVEMDVDLVHYKELALRGSYDSTIAQYEDALALLRAGTVQVKPLISHRLPLSGVQEGYEVARKQSGLKVMILP
jgi:L-iditol 2-dehydrogenase